MALITAFAFAPAALALWLLLTVALNVPNLETLTLAAQEAPTRALTQLVQDPRQAAVLTVCFLVLYLIGQSVASAAATDQVYAAALSTARPWWASLGRAVVRLPRTLPALLVLMCVIAFPFALSAAVALALVAAGEKGWVGIVVLAALALVVSGALSLWLYGRLSLLPTAAVLAPRRTFSARIALRVTSHRWWSVVGRLLLVALLVGALFSTVAAPLSLAGLSGASTVVALAAVARIALSVLSTALTTAAAALIYADVEAPSDLRR